MAKIILVWNTHPTESAATLPVARLLKTDLEKRGHKVSIQKVPFIKTLHGSSNQTESNVAQTFSKQYPESFVIDLHAGPDDKLVLPHRRGKPKKLRTEYTSTFFSDFTKNAPALARSDNLYFLELPAKFTESRGIFKRKSQNVKDSIKHRFERQADLKQTKASNYFTERVIRKIGHKIDDAIKFPDKQWALQKKNKSNDKRQKKKSEKKQKKEIHSTRSSKKN
ncbi:hypothetical protein KKG83_01760 [Candidatus Micrarchaeota archaeon]|nr:hypothetical protein [Candidatus Micrarchaeota archaeon]